MEGALSARYRESKDEQPEASAHRPTRRRFVVAQVEAGQRLDRYLADRLPELSRARVQELIAEGHVRVNGAASKRARRVSPGQHVAVDVLPRPPVAAVPEAVPLDVLYEDEDVVVVNKPAGMVVHAGAGATAGTLVNALVHRFRQLSSVGGALRPGIVHRLDRSTSGAIVVARNDVAHRCLAEQFLRRSVEKTYVALLHGRFARDSGTIALAIARDLRRRTRMTTRRAPEAGRAARTAYRVLARLPAFTLVEVRLHTGRTHQIRVHFSALGHPVVGDTLYGAPRQARAGQQAMPPLARNFLHAARIRFEHPRTGAGVDVRAPLPGELIEYLERLAEAQGADAAAIDAALRDYI